MFVTNFLILLATQSIFNTQKNAVNAKELNGRLTGETLLTKSDSPHTVTGNVVVEPEAVVEIQPGAELRFQPGVSLKVYGQLTAVGTAADRITFTKSDGGSVSDSPPQWPADIRLANGSDIYEGVVQVLFKGQWRGICANSANWTALDAAVVCRQLGFDSPVNDYFTYNFTATDYHSYIAISHPNCTGDESGLLSCPGSKAPMYSSQICRDQRSLYLKCQGLRTDLIQEHWAGMQFYNTTFSRVVSAGDSLNESTSILQYVDVLYAGVTNEKLPTAAISASPYVPKLQNVRVMFSAYDGINFTDINSTTVINDCEVAHNRGHGLNVTTSLGRVRITNSRFHSNRGNGLYVRTVDKIYRRWEWRTGDFCVDPIASAYPQLYTGVAPSGSRECPKKFVTSPGRFLTISVLEMEKDPTVGSAKLELYNGDCLSRGCDTSDVPLLQTWDIKDLEFGTIGLPQSEVTTQHYLTVIFKLDSIYNRQNQCLKVAGCVRFVLLIASSDGSASEDVILQGVTANDNNLHGALIENPRSFIKVTGSEFSRNEYGAGFRIRGGAADVDMRDTVMDDNSNSGLNITYSGGRRIMSNVKARRNNGIGMYIDYIHEYKTRVERHQKTEFISAIIEDNAGIGLRAGNYCADSVLSFNLSSSISRNGAEGIHILSCYGDTDKSTNFTVRDSYLTANGYQAIKVSPMLSMIGLIKKVVFSSHSRGVILIDNTADLQRNRVFLGKMVDYVIEDNRFTDNRGPYVVNMRLTESGRQKLSFKFNRLTGNSISLSETILKPRSRARAVIVVSSSNVLVNRNELVNADSNLEICTHSTDTAITIDAAMNWWGGTAGSDSVSLDSYYKKIVGKIIDQETRYNLASVEYFPALIYDNLESDPDSRTGVEDPRKFDRTIDGVLHLGGQMKADFRTAANTEYIVDSDINIAPSKEFTISPGTVLKFDNTVGVLVRGKIYAVGTSQQPIVLKRREEENPHANITWIRLSGGEDALEGVLELNITGEWATVCNKGWTMREASVVCQHFGYTLQPEAWTMSRPRDFDEDQPIIYNYVKCLHSDSDILECIHDEESEFNDCTHEDDVTMRCVPPTWAGVKLVASANKSELRHVSIEEAGLLDYFTNEFVPALEVDKNYHYFSDLHITRSSSTGMSIVYSEPFGLDTTDISNINNISRSTFSDNLGDGFSTKSSYLTLEDCIFSRNGQSGFIYDPKLPLLTAFNIRKAIPADEIIDISSNMSSKTELREPGVVKYFQAKDTGRSEEYSVIFELEAADTRRRVTVQVLDYSPETYIERLVIYDGNRDIMDQAQQTAIDEDNVDLPLVSSSNSLTLLYSINGTKSGRLMLSISSMPLADVPDMVGTVPTQVRATIRLKNCELTDNKRGLLLTHYNNPSNEHMDIFVRTKFEQVVLDNVTVTGNSEEAMLVPSVTKYNEVYMPTIQLLEAPHRMANITYYINNCRFSNNGRGILAEHNHVDYSNNMWRWKYTNNVVSTNMAGGLQIELPLILDQYNNGNHSIEINNSRFEDNAAFEFAITGGFANLSIFQNSFQKNTAKKGLIELSGTEKDMFVSENEIVNNRGKFMMDIDMSSHSEFGVNQPAVVYKNSFRDNNIVVGSVTGSRGEEATVAGYTLALRGVQKVNITRNLFSDQLPFTFVADVPSTSLTTEVNVRYNYWSTTNQSVIRQKIFDFSDWSSYAIANYTGFLLANSYDSQTSSEPMETVHFDLNRPLGGIISSDLTIPYREDDYHVVSDITILSGVTVKVEAGVTFRISPSIGFLVLGRLLANGLSRNKIRFLPVEKESTPSRSIRYRRQQDEYFAPSNITSADGLCRETVVKGLRLCGGEDEKEGFLKMYNTTINAWSLVCDPQFNDRTAEVFCRSMNFYSGNVAVRYSELYEYFTFGRDRDLYKDLWTRTYLCKGDENHIDECGQKINYNLQRCSLTRGYVFIRCGERNLDLKYDFWGNLRFATDSPEAAVDDIARSSLRNVEIAGAGVLHGNKVSAVMSTYQTPSTYNLDIHDCADGGLDFISPRSDVFLLNSKVENNLGTAINILVLNGEKGEYPSQFKPLNSSSVPYRVFGMINMCDSEKVIDVDRRVLVYYKYDFESIGCVKVFRNIHKTQLNIRFLQVNLFSDDFSRNSVEVFDGPDFVEHLLLKDIRADSIEQEKRSVYKTTTYYNVEFKEYQLQYQMGVHIHASPASGVHGFIAEITTSSSSYTGAEGVHKVIGNMFHKNYGGSLRYSTVGETNPGIVVTGNVFRGNGLDVLNLTSTENVLLEAQNVPALSVSNNMFDYNNGSCTIWLSADGDASKVVRGNVSNNIFYGTINGEALRIYGNSYQEVMVLFNYIVANVVDNLNTVDLRYVIVNVTGNTLYKNQGAHGMDIWSSNDITFSKQLVEFNQFYDNFPGDKFKDSQHGGNNTMLYSAGHYSNKRIRNNWFENRFYFELSTHNRTSTNEKPSRDPTMQVDAQYNYWGHKIGVDNTELIIRARMHDYRDDTNLSMIDYSNFYADNISLPQMEGSYETGYCLVGWKLTVSQRCYRYYGGITTYPEAQAICALENATVVKPNNQFWVEIGEVIDYSQQDYSDQVRAWVDEPEKARPTDKCSVIIDSRYDEADCTDRLPFVCESDQIGALSPTWRDWLYLWVILGIGGFLLLLSLVVVVLYCRKSQLRKDERMERRNSLRSSIRSNKYAINNGALTQGSQTNIASSMYGSRNALANRPMARGRATSREATHSIALTDFTMGETDVDLDDTETVATKRNGYSSTGYAGSVDSSRRGSRDDLSQSSQPIRYDSPVAIAQDNTQLIQPQTPPRVAPRPQSEYNRYGARAPAPVHADYNNEGYSTDSSPRHQPTEPSAEQFQPVTVQPAPRGAAAPDPAPAEHAYINTSRLQREPEPEPSVDVSEMKRRELYNQRRPARPAPAASAYQPSAAQPSQPPLYSSSNQPPGYATATREDNMRPSVQARPSPPPTRGYQHDYSSTKRDSFSTVDTKSLDSYDSEFSMSKPPLSYRPYDHHRQYSDEKKPFETDIDSMYSEDQPDTVSFQQHRQSPVAQYRQRLGGYQPSPLTRDVPTAYDSDVPSQRVHRMQEQYSGSQHNLDGSGPDASYYGGYGGPPAETDIDAMSEMTDDWNRKGPPVETDF